MLIETIDCDYTMPQYACAYLVIKDGKACFIENNTAHAVPKMMERLKAHGLSEEAVQYCIITHVHLDHAGGSSTLMKACPKATLIAHPRAAPHVVDPSKLVGSAKGVYGEARFQQLYGEIEPVPESRVMIMEDDSTLDFAGETFRFLHTRGHANHHFVVLAEQAMAVFTGDAFGLAYPTLQPDRGVFAIPSTSPTDFDGPLAKESVDRIVQTKAKTLYLTHFGGLTAIAPAAEQLKQTLSYSETLVEQAYLSELSNDELEASIKPKLKAHFEQRLQASEVSSEEDSWKYLALDLDLNAQGLAFAAMKKRKKSPKPNS